MSGPGVHDLEGSAEQKDGSLVLALFLPGLLTLQKCGDMSSILFYIYKAGI